MTASLPDGPLRSLARSCAPERAWAQGVLLALVAAAYAGSLFGGFASDDWAMIVDNEANMGSLAVVPKFFTSPVWAFSNVENGDRSLYRPAWLLWQFLVYGLSGQQPLGWHLANVALHTANVFLVAALVERLVPGVARRDRYLAAALFAVHPALSQSVAWVTGSTDILMTTGFLAGVLSHLRFRDTGRTRHLVLTAVWFAVAVLSKEAAFVFPAVVIACDLCQGAGGRTLRVRAYAALFGVAGAYLLARTLALQAVLQAGSNLFEISAQSLARLAEYLLLYARFLAVPWPVPYYMRHVPEGLAEGYDIGLGAAVIAGLLYAAVRRRTRFPVLWMAFTLAVPLLLALHDRGQFAVRFLYLPAAGGAVLAAAVLSDLRQRWPRAPTPAALGLAALLAALTHAETLAWQSQETWARKVIAFDPGASSGWLALARDYVRQGNGGKAVRTYRMGLEQATPMAEKVKVAEALGLYYADGGRFAESLEQYRWISEQEGFEAKGLLGVGNNYWMMRRFEDALDAYRRARRFAPRDRLLLFNLALVNEQLGHAAQAAAYYRELLRLAPSWSNAQALARARRFLEATGR